MGAIYFRNFVETLLNLIFPRRCPICEDIIGESSKKICKACNQSLSYIKEPRCKKCSKSTSSIEAEYCYDCSLGKHYYDEGIAVFNHDQKIRRSIYSFKYNNKREYSDFYSEIIVKNYKQKILGWGAQVLIPVPLHVKKKQQRGFNQAEILAVKLSKELNIPVDTTFIERTRYTDPQKQLDNKQRSKNVKNAFKIVKKIVKYKKVVLIDDIYTTGATIDSCAKALKEAGVTHVYFVTISIGNDV